jgi:hypothetical protein
VARDCSVICWKGKQLRYAAVAAFATIAYVPWAYYTSPAWQFFHDNVILKDQPKVPCTAVLQRHALPPTVWPAHPPARCC